jgi:hypothetical protein
MRGEIQGEEAEARGDDFSDGSELTSLSANSLRTTSLSKDLRYAVYLLYWYKSTNTDAGVAQIDEGDAHLFYLHYWYKSTNTDAAVAQNDEGDAHLFYLHYWYKSTNTDAAVAQNDEGDAQRRGQGSSGRGVGGRGQGGGREA